MKKLMIIAMCVTMALVASGAGFAGATYYVSTTGSDITGNGTALNPWASIDRGDVLGVLASGDTVRVAAGTYNENVKVGAKSAGVLYQADAAGVTVKSTGGWSAWEVGGMVGAGAYGWGLNYGLSGVTIDGFTISGGNPGWYGALSLYNAYLTEVKNCTIDGGGGSTTPYMGSLVMQGGAQNYVHNNVVKYGGTGNAVYVYDSRYDGNKIVNNTVLGNPGGWGINVAGYQAGYQPGQGAYAGKYDSIYNNIVEGGFYALSTPTGYTVDYGYNLLHGAIAYGGGAAAAAGDIVGLSPMLDGTYHLLPGSPAIDAGINVGLAYNGSAPDMGAFETVPEPGTLVALGMGLLGLGGFRLRRKS